MRIPRRLRHSALYLKNLWKSFSGDNGALMAASVSFFTFLSIAPLLLLAAAAFAFFLRSERTAYDETLRFLSNYAPSGKASIVPILQAFVHGSTAATGFGIITLLWAGSQAFVNLEISINIAWGRRPRGFLTSRLIAFLLVIAVGLLLLVSLCITAAATAAQHRHLIVFHHNISEMFGWVWPVFAYILPLLVSIGTFTLIYKLLPNTHVPIRHALIGGTVAGLLWDAAKYAFGWYVSNFAHYSAVYGSLGGIILLLVWIYYSSIVTILGAEIAAIEHKKHGLRSNSTSPAERKVQKHP